VEIDLSFSGPNAAPYEVEGRKDGKPFYFTVASNGNYLGTD